MEIKSPEQMLAELENLQVAMRHRLRKAALELTAAKARLKLRFLADADAQGNPISMAKAQDLVNAELVGGKLNEPWSAWSQAKTELEACDMRWEDMNRKYWDTKKDRR